MEPWFLYTIAATLLYGVMYFVQKSGANRGYPSTWIVNISTTTVALFALTAALLEGQRAPDTGLLLLYAGLNGTFYGLGSMIHFKAFKILPAGIAFPLGKVNVVFIALAGILLFGERFTASQALAVLIFFLVVLLLTRREPHQPVAHLATGVLLVLAAGLCTTVSVTTGKYAAAAPGLPKTTYMALSYTLVACLTFALGRLRSPRENSWKVPHAVGIGVIAGVCNFAGYWCILQAFSTGKLSVIHPIFSLSILVPIVLAMLFHGEKMTVKKGLALALALLAVVLMKVDLLKPLFSPQGPASLLPGKGILF